MQIIYLTDAAGAGRLLAGKCSPAWISRDRRHQKTAETHIYLLELWKKRPICSVIISPYIKCCRDVPDPTTVKAEIAQNVL